jgi:hypothetical protein
MLFPRIEKARVEFESKMAELDKNEVEIRAKMKSFLDQIVELNDGRRVAEKEYSEFLKMESGQKSVSIAFRHPEKAGRWVMTSVNAHVLSETRFHNGKKYDTIVSGSIRRVGKNGDVDDSKSPETYRHNLSDGRPFPLEIVQ